MQLGSRRPAKVPVNVGTVLSRRQRYGVRLLALADVLVLM